MKKIVFLAAILVACSLKTSTAQTQTEVKKHLVPGEQAPPADLGQKNFGGMRPAVGAGGQRLALRPPRPEPKIQTVSLEDILNERSLYLS